MTLISTLRHTIGLRSPLRLAYHWCRGVIAYLLSGNPAKGMYIVGVTGTKGKTTTCTLIATALEASGVKVALFTTAQTWMPGEKRENQSKMTMDSPFKLWKLLREAKNKGVTHVILETSSHGIYYFRNFGIRYDIVALTNISQDHLDLHGTMEHYVATKARLFESEKGKICVLPRDCEYLETFSRAMKNKITSHGLDPRASFVPHDHEDDAKLITYSFREEADYRVTDFSTTNSVTHITLQEKGHTQEITTRLVGTFNVENIATAYSLLRSMNISADFLSTVWVEFTGAPGRMESVPNTWGINVIIDYAHTEASLRSVLTTLQVQKAKSKKQNDGFFSVIPAQAGIQVGTETDLTPDTMGLDPCLTRGEIHSPLRGDEKIILVFGATGDRDTTKRPKMGAVAHELADVIILTDDDTYTESSERIIDMVKGGIPRTIGDSFQIIPDRAQAIARAISIAQAGDTVLIAGKGCETVQVTNSGSIPWSDRGLAEKYLALK